MASFENGALVISWGSAIPGREARMLDVLNGVFEYTRNLGRAGRIDQTRVFVSTTGPNRDTMMVFGRLDELTKLLIDDEFEGQLQDGMMVVQDLNIALWAGGLRDELTDGLIRHAQKLHSHGLV